MPLLVACPVSTHGTAQCPRHPTRLPAAGVPGPAPRPNPVAYPAAPTVAKTPLHQLTPPAPTHHLSPTSWNALANRGIPASPPPRTPRLLLQLPAQHGVRPQLPGRGPGGGQAGAGGHLPRAAGWVCKGGAAGRDLTAGGSVTPAHALHCPWASPHQGPPGS